MKLTSQITGQLIIKTEYPVKQIEEKYDLSFNKIFLKHAPGLLKWAQNKNNSKIELISHLILNKR